MMLEARTGVAGDDLRHDGGVGDTQPIDTIDAQPRIDHRVGADAHAAGADRMQVGDAAGADVGDYFGVGGDRRGPGKVSSTM